MNLIFVKVVFHIVSTALFPSLHAVQSALRNSSTGNSSNLLNLTLILDTLPLTLSVKNNSKFNTLLNLTKNLRTFFRQIADCAEQMGFTF